MFLHVDLSLNIFIVILFLYQKSTTTWLWVLKCCFVGMTPNIIHALWFIENPRLGSVNGAQSNFVDIIPELKCILQSLAINLRTLVCHKVSLSCFLNYFSLVHGFVSFFDRKGKKWYQLVKVNIFLLGGGGRIGCCLKNTLCMLGGLRGRGLCTSDCVYRILIFILGPTLPPPTKHIHLCCCLHLPPLPPPLQPPSPPLLWLAAWNETKSDIYFYVLFRPHVKK